MVAKPNEQVPIWTYAEASGTVPHIRLMLRDMREGFIFIWRLYRLAGCDVNHPDYGEQIQELGGEARTLLAEFDSLGIIPYQSPLRGIALYPVLVQDDRSNKLREAYFIFKDTRDGIETYIFTDDLVERNDLYADEKRVPEDWKETGAVPRPEREEGR